MNVLPGCHGRAHHRQVLQPAELWSVVSSTQLEEEEQSDDDSSDDEG